MREWPNFPTPHCHQQSLDTGSTPEAFADREIALGTGTLTATDHGTLAGAQKVYAIAKSRGLTPILGCELYFRDDNCPILAAAGIPKTGGDPKKGTPDTYLEYNKYYHLTVHCLDGEAYETLVRLLSAAEARAERHGSERKPIFDWAGLEELGASNVIFTSGCLIGMVQRHILAGRPDIANSYYDRLRSLVKPGNFYVEMFPHRCDKNWVNGVFLTFADGTTERYYPEKNLLTNVGEIKAAALAKQFAKTKGNEHTHLHGVKNYSKWNERDPAQLVQVKYVTDFVTNECQTWAPDGDTQLGTNKYLRRLARKYGDPMLISDDSHFANPDEKVVQDIRLLQGSGGRDSWRFYGSYHRQSSSEAYDYFKQYMKTSEDEFQGWVENNQAWGSRFKDFKLRERKSLPVSFFPSDTLSYTMALVKRHGRMDWKNKKYVARLRAEIDLLHNNGTIDLLPYFMIDEEVCDIYAKDGLLTGPGRGSAAGMLLTYLLGITHVDPIKYGLSMDRFLTLDRIRSGKLPDIDQDLPHRDLLTESCTVEELEIVLDNGETVTVSPKTLVTTTEGKIFVEDALRQGLDFDWVIAPVQAPEQSAGGQGGCCDEG